MRFEEKPHEAQMLVFAHDRARNLDLAKDLLLKLHPHIGTVKYHVLFVKYYCALLEVAHELGLKTMVDFKMFQPQTTARDLLKEFSWLQVDSATIHLLGGSRMAKAALDAVGDRMTIYGVTVPTDMDQKTMNEELRIPGTILDQVLHLTELGLNCGLRHFVCSGSAGVAGQVRARFGGDIRIFSPGIRFAGNSPDMHDPEQVATPYEAALYVDELVMGTELLQGEGEAADLALTEIRIALADRTRRKIRFATGPQSC